MWADPADLGYTSSGQNNNFDMSSPTLGSNPVAVATQSESRIRKNSSDSRDIEKRRRIGSENYSKSKSKRSKQRMSAVLAAKPNWQRC